MRYVGDPIGQIDGSVFAHYNCVAAGTAELIDICTVGRLRFSGAAVRRASGINIRRGLQLTEAADAAVELTHGAVILDPRYLEANGTQRGRLQARVASGSPCGVVIDTNLTYGTPYATNLFRGLHFVVVAAYRWREIEKPHAEFLVEDPGTTKAGWRWWPADLVYRAAEKAGNGGIWILGGEDTENVVRVTRTRANLRAAARWDSADLGSIRVGRSKTVIRTMRGGKWKRADGTTAEGWVEVRKKTGRLAYAKGECFA